MSRFGGDDADDDDARGTDARCHALVVMMLMMMMPEARRQGVTLWRLLVTMAHNFLHLLRLDVLQFVDVEALFLVCLRDENDATLKFLPRGGSRRKPGRLSIEQYPTRV